MFNEIIEYFSKMFFPALAQIVIPPMLYSGLLVKFVPLEPTMPLRFRLNIMLQWEYGWFKSTVLRKVAQLFNFRIHELTASSSAALRGSYIDNEFYPPELLISDLLIVPEFVGLLEGDKDLVSQFLHALEDARLRVALVKGGKMPKTEIAKIEALGAKFIEKRLEYVNRCTVWSATHTLDGIPERYRDALTSRFYICSLTNAQIPDETAWSDPLQFYDQVFEEKAAKWVQSVYEKAINPDLMFAEDVIRLLHGYLKGEKKKPREVGDFRRMAVAHHEYFPTHSPQEAALYLQKFTNAFAGMNSRELIAQYLYNNAHTFDEIQQFTGLKKANIFSQFRRLGVKSIGNRPKQYYLETYETVSDVGKVLPGVPKMKKMSEVK